MRSIRALAAASAAAVLALSGLVFLRAQDAKPAAPAAPAAAAKSDVVIPFLGNEKCAMSGKAINKSKFVEAGKERVYFCCKSCVDKAKADPKAAAAAAYKEAKPVGNKTCPISGHAIDAAKAKMVSFEGHSVALCCADCEKAFNESPALFTIKAVYGCEDVKNVNCPVMKVNDGKDHKAETDEDDFVIYKGKLIRFCCSDCPEEFAKDPAKFLAAAGIK